MNRLVLEAAMCEKWTQRIFKSRLWIVKCSVRTMRDEEMKNSDETVQALEQHLAESHYPPQTLSLSSWIHEQCLCHLMLLTTGHLETKLYCWFQLYLPLFLPTSKSKWIIEHENKEENLIEKIKPVPTEKKL